MPSAGRLCCCRALLGCVAMCCHASLRRGVTNALPQACRSTRRPPNRRICSLSRWFASRRGAHGRGICNAPSRRIRALNSSSLQRSARFSTSAPHPAERVCTPPQAKAPTPPPTESRTGSLTVYTSLSDAAFLRSCARAVSSRVFTPSTPMSSSATTSPPSTSPSSSSASRSIRSSTGPRSAGCASRICQSSLVAAPPSPAPTGQR